MTRVLLVEDDDRLRAALALTLSDEGYPVVEAATLAEARRFCTPQAVAPEVILLDVRLGPHESGVDLIRWLASEGRLPPTVVVSGAATVAEAVEALRLGVFDFIEKPVSRERLLQAVKNALEHDRLVRRVEHLEQQLDSDRELLGSSAPMTALREQIARVAATDARVLIVGETGTGKELVAEQIHRLSRRRDQPFVKINCAAIPAPLIEAELFGHAKGAFTDAHTARAGHFEEANGGTLLLDEIGDMEPLLQARLLRVLEDGVVRRLGESQERQVDVRVVAATHRHLDEGADADRFRQDLYFRLAHVPLHVPPLRERGEDVLLLFQHFVAVFSARHRLRLKQVQDDVAAVLRAYAWPGNVRELRNLCEHQVVMGADPLSAAQLPAHLRPGAAAAEGGWLRLTRLASGELVAFKRFKQECEREYVEAALERCGWNVAGAARLLGLQRTHLHAKVVALGIARPGCPLSEADE